MVCLVAATLLWPALAQAPGDREFDECGDDDHTYPPEWRVLFDTWNYEDLFDGWPLRVVNQDGGDGVSVLYLRGTLRLVQMFIAEKTMCYFRNNSTS